MKRPLRILHLEDDPDFSELVQTLLDTDGMQAELVLVGTRDDFEAALARKDFDLILADYLLPEYNGLEALAAARQRSPQVPFLLVSGAIGEAAAIDSLKSGATDFVLKSRLDRLLPAIRRAAQESEERSQRRHAESELARRERYFRSLMENALDVLVVVNREGVFLYCSPSAQQLLGYQPAELLGTRAFDLVHPDDLPLAVQTFQRGVQNPKNSITHQFRARHKDGSWRFLEAVGQSRLDDPEVRAIIINIRDVTDRRRVEEELRESEKQYRLIFDGNPTPMWVFDHETLAFLEVNDAAVQHYGYSRAEFLTLKLQDLRPPGEGPAQLEYVHRLLASGNPAKMGLAGVWQHRKKDGTLIDVEVKWSPISFKGRPASLTMANDITERRKAEHRDAALSQLSQRLSWATSPADAADTIRDVADDLFVWDAFTLDLYAAEQDKVIPILNIDTDRSGQQLVISADGQVREPSGMARRVIAQGAELILREEPIARADDTTLFGDTSRYSASVAIVPIRNGKKVIGVLSIQSYRLRAYDHRDLSTLQMLADHCGGALERIRTEAALHESKQRFRDLFECSPDAIFVEDIEGRVLDVNPAGCRLHGLKREELIGRNAVDLVPPEAREEVARNHKHLGDLGDGALSQLEGMSQTADGQAIPVEIRARRIDYGGLPAFLLHVRDITDRKLAEAALRSSENLFHSVWENSVDGMRLTDEEGHIVAVNDAFCSLVSMPREELEGRPFTAVYADSESHERSLQKHRERFRDRVIEQQTERKLTLRNGKVVIFEDTSSFVELRGQPRMLLSLFRDVTAQKQLEEQLRQSQKMEAIGQLAGGVAHDFNNILTIIHGHASLLVHGGVTGSAAKSAQQILQAAERAAGLTRQMLAFSRRQVMQLRLLDLNEVVQNMTRMLGRILGEDIALQLHYASEPALAEADAGMMEQVLLNLVVNARDAMPKGGLLAIRVSTSDLEPTHPARATGLPAQFVFLSVTDTGCGIAPENLGRIFEPFFTTKEIGKGTGLGLATVYGIVKQHHGWIDVESQIDHGTTFRILLPRAAARVQPVPEPPVEKPIPGGHETILVVEDETPVRELVCQLLSSYGYRVLQAESGVQAIKVWNEHKERIDLLLTDLIMPNQIDGKELASRLRNERPGLKVVFTSGYSADGAAGEFASRRTPNYLQKPYHPHKLARAVRECLDAVD